MTSPSLLLFDRYYHIFNRGVNKETIFKEERNYSFFLNLYTKYIVPISQTFAYCLLSNHFHFLVRIKSKEEIGIENIPFAVSESLILQDPEIPENYPSKCFSNFFNAYAKSINRSYGRSGSLFLHPFGRVEINSDKQFDRVIAYIHQNPQKHGLVENFRTWKYSSYLTLLSEKSTHLNRKAVLGWFGGRDGFLQNHSKWSPEMNNDFFGNDED